ncbi:hypothetical protein SKAU_G00156850 [Synaphobranchus kaupii]|uniref:Uncharacterized protein n=1 Tax=Synaphobranchus kaupii TaxID=118154 RepID=A0A9Q1IZC9_SYNKA|nr:hypothetical protein SKAU_G00156850 [Synaphobranchus kaupii]
MNFIKTLAKGSKEPEVISKPEKEQKSLKMEKSPPVGGATPAPSEPKEQDPNVKESGSTFSKIFRQKSLKDSQPSATNVAQDLDPAAGNKAGKVAPPPDAAESKGKAPMKSSSKKELPKVTLGVPSVSKQKDSAFSKLFRPKVDPSKANTLEASSMDKSAKQEGKKAEKSSFASFFKCGDPKPQ